MPVKLDIAESVQQQGYNDLIAPSAKPIGKTAGDLFELVENVFGRPIAHLNMQLKAYWDKVDKDWKQEKKRIPEEKRIEPSFQVAQSTISAFQSAVDNDDLRALLIRILGSASNSDMSNNVIPSYPAVLKRLSSDEIKLFIYFSNAPTLPFVSIFYEIIKDNKSIGHVLVEDLFSNFGLAAGCKRPDSVPIYVDNLVSARLISIPEGEGYIDESVYSELENSEHIQSLKAQIEATPGRKIQIIHKIIRLTSFGRGLGQACRINDLPEISDLTEQGSSQP